MIAELLQGSQVRWNFELSPQVPLGSLTSLDCLLNRVHPAHGSSAFFIFVVSPVRTESGVVHTAGVRARSGALFFTSGGGEASALCWLQE
jgi:hypothetical protein